MLRLAPVIAAALVLTACDERQGASVSITGDNGSAGIANGTARIDVPGFKGELRLPKFDIAAADLDIDGVKLFPGSSVRGVNVDAKDSPQNDGGTVRISFASPAGPAVVRDHFRRQFAEAGFKTSDAGSGLSGITKDHKPVVLTLTPAGTDKTNGELTIGGGGGGG